MSLYDFILGNREIFKLIYAFIIILISTLIVFRAHKLFRISSHDGIRYFRNAFFFFGAGFFIRFFVVLLFVTQPLLQYAFLIDMFFEFFLVMGGFFFLYSLVWKKFETPGKESKSSLLNPRIFIFYLMTIIIVVLDLIWRGHHFLFVSQIAVFFLASIISYINCKKRADIEFPKFYLLAMTLALVVWVLNTLAALVFNWNPIVMINIYILNLIFFLLLLYGVVKALKN